MSDRRFPIGMAPTCPVIAAPQIKIGQEGAAESVEPAAAGDLTAWRDRFLQAFGTSEPAIAEALFNQLINALHTDPKEPLSASTANLALALLHRLAPRNELEGMLCVQLIVAHVASMDVSRRGLHADQSVGGRQAYLGLARKLMALFTTQVETLNRLRGTTVVQKVIVERVNVEAGGKALVGAVSGRSGGPEDA
jgi:hypothetical protein